MPVSYEEIEFEVFPDVYPPSEDSFLIAKYSERLKGRILDLCCGCGFLGIINAKRNPGNAVLGADISKSCVENSMLNAKRTKAENYSCIKSSLFSKVKGEFDWIICNPPYLPTSRAEKIAKPLNFAFDGGKDGRKLIDRFLKQAPAHLGEKGGLLLLDSSLDDTGKTISWLEGNGFKVRILQTQSMFFEKISVIEARL